jgi:hypothetical protein
VSARSLLLGLLILTTTPLLFAVAPPLGPDRPLTAQERRLLAGQARSLFERLGMLHKTGRVKEALDTAEQIVAVQEKLYGACSDPVAQGLEWIARQSRAVGADEQAIAFAQRAYRLRQRLHPEGDWRVVDARLDLEEARNQARRDEAARQQLRKAEGLNVQVVRLWQ